MGRTQRLLAGACGIGALVMGCAKSDGDDNKPAAPAAHLLALSTYSASLGTPVDAFFENPPSATAQKIELVFDGTFMRSDGSTKPVSMAQTLVRTEAGAARWSSFGPFSNPFQPDNPATGVFQGKVSLRVTNDDGTQTTDGNPLPISFEVRPSLIVTDFQPTTATCAKPALRLIGSMPYKMSTTAIGFKPTSIDYTFTMPSIVPDPSGWPTLDIGSDGKPQTRDTKLSHKITAAIDTIGDKEAIILPPVPDDQPSYGVVVAITARDDAGHTVTSTFGMEAHKPLEVFYDGRYELAQIYPAAPVSSCMPGGQQGRAVAYAEAQTETRQRSLSLTLSKTFLKSDENNWSTSDGKTVTHGTTNTDGYSKMHGTENSFNFTQSHSDTNGVEFNWSDSHSQTNGWEYGGSAKLTVGLPEVLFGGEVGVDGHKNGSTTNTQTQGGSTMHSSTDGWSKGETNSTLDQSTVDHSTATTDSTAVTTTDTKGGSSSTQNGTGESQDETWTVSSSQTIDRAFGGMVIASTYGVFYRQMARYTRKAFVLEFNKCGEGDVVGDVTLQDYIWAPDLALGQACPPLPQSNFPQPQCYVAPCDP